MPSVLSENDEKTVNRTVARPANKIHAIAVARLYIAYPNKQQWVYTGLQGAAVLANDLVGNTYWIKMVDISGSNRGVIWDQEIYDPFFYNQDRTFFHSFELEECLAGLSFVNEKEAKQFKKKMDEREKNASKETKATPFQGAGGQPAGGNTTNGKPHSKFGLSSLLHGGHRHSSAPSLPPPTAQPQSILPPRESFSQTPKSSIQDKTSSLDTVDPSWRGLLGKLLEMGITEDEIEQNSDFIKDYIEQRKASGDPIGGGDATASSISGAHRVNAPPPPPAPPAGRLASISPQHTGSTAASKRGPAPAPPQPRRSRQENVSMLSSSQRRSPSPPEERADSPPQQQFQFRAPPPLADAGKFAHASSPSAPQRLRAASNVANPGPPPPPRPPKTPMEDEQPSKPKFGVPPPFHGEKTPSAVPPPPPSRVIASSLPRTSREPSQAHAIPPVAAPPPPLPPKAGSAPAPSAGPPPPPPARSNAAPPPPPLPSLPRPIFNAPASSGPPAPPPPPLLSLGAPPPPPMPPGGGPPPPPLPPGRDSVIAPPLPNPSGGKADMLASIRASGGIGGGALKRVSDKDKNDRSAAAVPGAVPSGPASTAPAAPSGGGGFGDAIAAALSKRNKKVSASDDEDDEDDDWDDPPKRR